MNARILLIDDEPDLLDALSIQLQSLGYEVHAAREKEEAEALLKHFSYTLIITDLALTNIGFAGLDVLASVWDRGRRPKVMVLTGHSEPELQFAAQRWGADAYVHKPRPLREVAKMVTSLLDRHV